jgi:hypothetical protein
VVGGAVGFNNLSNARLFASVSVMIALMAGCNDYEKHRISSNGAVSKVEVSPLAIGAILPSNDAAPFASVDSSTPSSTGHDFGCLLESKKAGIHIEFGYRGCFGGSNNYLDVELSNHAFLSGWFQTGFGTGGHLDKIPLERAEAIRHLNSLVKALHKRETDNGSVSTSTAFALISYWCGRKNIGPIRMETSSLEWAEELKMTDTLARATNQPVDHIPETYSRVHGVIAAATSILSAKTSPSNQ